MATPSQAASPMHSRWPRILEHDGPGSWRRMTGALAGALAHWSACMRVSERRNKLRLADLTPCVPAQPLHGLRSYDQHARAHRTGSQVPDLVSSNLQSLYLWGEVGEPTTTTRSPPTYRRSIVGGAGPSRVRATTRRGVSCRNCSPLKPCSRRSRMTAAAAASARRLSWLWLP